MSAQTKPNGVRYVVGNVYVLDSLRQSEDLWVKGYAKRVARMKYAGDVTGHVPPPAS